MSEERPFAGFVVHVSQPHHVLVDRSTPWGNPFFIGRDGTREEVVELFRAWVATSGDPKARWIRQNVHALRDKLLGCHCSPLPCHGEVLAEMAYR